MLKRLFILVALLASTTLLQAQSLSKEQQNEQRTEERHNRGLMSSGNTFVDKGQWIVGATASYTTHVNDNYSLVLIDNIESIGYNFNFSTMFAYTLAPNISVGSRVLYNRVLLRIDNSDISFGDDESSGVNMSLDNCYMLTHSYCAMAFMRQYIPLGRSKRFALFNEVQLSGGGSESKYTYDSPVQGTYSKTKDIALNFAPGVTAFISNRFAVEINVGAMGLSYSRTEQVHNQIEYGQSGTNMFNFNINILSLGFGISYYL